MLFNIWPLDWVIFVFTDLRREVVEITRSLCKCACMNWLSAICCKLPVASWGHFYLKTTVQLLTFVLASGPPTPFWRCPLITLHPFTHNCFPCLPLKTWDHSSIKMMYKMSLSLMLKGSPQWPQHVHDWSSSPGPSVNFLLPLPLTHEQDSVLKQNDVWINICMCVFILRL